MQRHVYTRWSPRFLSYTSISMTDPFGTCKYSFNVESSALRYKVHTNHVDMTLVLSLLLAHFCLANELEKKTLLIIVHCTPRRHITSK